MNWNTLGEWIGLIASLLTVAAVLFSALNHSIKLMFEKLNRNNQMLANRMDNIYEELRTDMDEWRAESKEWKKESQQRYEEANRKFDATNRRIDASLERIDGMYHALMRILDERKGT